tara:strand:+ start:236 stop:538 length:303 start_codon:yes stop_codon:yes gene_type:complete
MNWWDIIKGKYLSSRVLKWAKACIEETPGVKVVEFRLSKQGQSVAKCVYVGSDLPPGKTEIRFNNTVNLKKKGRSPAVCSGLRSRNRKELAKQQTFIGEW